MNLFSTLKKWGAYLISQVIVPNVIWTALLSIPSAFLSVKAITDIAAAVMVSKAIPLNLLVTAGICTLICFLALLSNLIFLAYKLLHKEQPIMQFPSLESSYRYSLMEYELYFKDREHILLRQTFHFEVSAENLTSISHIMQWTGNSYKPAVLSPESQQKGYHLKEKQKSAAMFGFDIVFPEPKAKGYSGSYSFELELEDLKLAMIPILAKLIKCETDKLVLKVTAPPGVIESCERLVSADITCDFILSEPQPVLLEKVGEYHCYRHTFTDLELLRYYMLRWNWASAKTNSD